VAASSDIIDTRIIRTNAPRIAHAPIPADPAGVTRPRLLHIRDFPT
jgi:hypothetical protein